MKPEYPVVLRPLSTDDGGGWVAIVPDLPGCMSDGDTAFQALQNVEDAIEEWKDAASQMGRPIPHPDDSSRRVLLRRSQTTSAGKLRTTLARCSQGSGEA